MFVIGDVASNIFYDFISTQLGQQTFRTEEMDENSDYDATHYTSDYDYDMRAIRAAQTEFAQNVQEEGSVILKMGGLPIAKTGSVTLLGAASAAGFLTGGSGSGAISPSSVPTLREIFEDAGYSVNPTMWAYYDTGAGRSTQSANARTVGEAAPPAEGSSETRSIADYSDAGIVVLGRAGAEASDIPFTTSEDPNKHFLELSANEVVLVQYACDHFDTVVVLLNTMQPVELSPIMDMDIAVMWIGAAGEQGATAIPELLNGTRNPSGRLVDTYANDLLGAPAVANQGNFLITNLADEDRSGNYYVYAEGIYVGYRYYETRYADVVMDTPNVGDFDYAAEVMFPYGYGCSYSTFEYSDYALRESGDTITVEVTVTNTSDVPGKEVVQIYMQSPYTQFDRDNAIEKSAVELVGFTKTSEIAAGGSETVTVEIPREYMRVYDSAVNRTYIVEEGEYYFAAGKDAHDALNNILAAQGYGTEEGMTAAGDADLAAVVAQDETDTTTYAVGEDGEAITNRFDKDTITYYDEDFTYLTRSDWTGTMPVAYGGENATGSWNGQITADAKMLADNVVPDPVLDESDEMPTTGANNGLTLADMFGLPYDHELWSDLLDQLTYDDMASLLIAHFGNAAVTSINKPYLVDSDGPQGITTASGGTATGFGYPIEVLLASTWNLELADTMGSLIGEDSLVTLVPGWYAPAVNIHRSAFSGRNFEYYSEDPLMNGLFAGHVIEQAAEKGVYCYMKHFALNDQETNRNSSSTFANEQTIRQIYLRAFEIPVRDFGANAMMLSMNRIGMTWSGHHVGLLQNVVRGEWGFIGVINTDASGRFGTDINDSAVYAGTDCFLNVGGTINASDFTSATMMNALREASHRLLYVTGNSNGMNGITPTTRIIDITPPWVIWLIVANVVFIGASVVGIVFNTINIVKKTKKEVSHDEANR